MVPGQHLGGLQRIHVWLEFPLVSPIPQRGRSGGQVGGGMCLRQRWCGHLYYDAYIHCNEEILCLQNGRWSTYCIQGNMDLVHRHMDFYSLSFSLQADMDFFFGFVPCLLMSTHLVTTTNNNNIQVKHIRGYTASYLSRLSRQQCMHAQLKGGLLPYSSATWIPSLRPSTLSSSPVHLR